MQLVWILLIAAAITVIEILIYHYRLPRFFCSFFHSSIFVWNMHCFLHSASAGTGYELLSAMDTNRYLSSAASVIPVYHDRLPRTQICKAGIYKTVSPYRLPSVCISSDQYAFHLSHNHLFCTGICYLLSKCKSSGSGYAHGG